jgi:hypothetical protein
MKVTIPPELKADLPQTRFFKLLSATPVVMAVVATMLAGLASSEMTRAQYLRSLAAQQQSKAGDQWGYFQAKRLRSAVQRDTLDLLRNTVVVHPLETAEFKAEIERLPDAAGTVQAGGLRGQALALLATPAGQQMLAALASGELPGGGRAWELEAAIQSAIDVVEGVKPEPEVRAALAQVSDLMVRKALEAAYERVRAFDAATKPINQAVDAMDAILNRGIGGGGRGAPELVRDFTAARLRYASLRYEAEARLNQTVANLYELQVRKSNIEAERHHARSQRFFLGMLAAQLGVIVSTLAMAARQRNLLWSLAAAAGLLAIGFAVYVYLCV